jgi:hypothetical protein
MAGSAGPIHNHAVQSVEPFARDILAPAIGHTRQE